MDLVMGLLVVPLEPLEESKDHPVLVVIARRESQVFDLQKIAEIVQMSLFSLTQILALEKQSLVVAGRDDKENVLKSRLKSADLGIHDRFGDGWKVLELT